MPTPSPYPLTIQDAPIVVGEQPANDANAIVGTWSTNNLLLTATGDISGRIRGSHITFTLTYTLVAINVLLAAGNH